MIKIGRTERELLEAALNIAENSLVHWGFKVGATVLAEDGKIYSGCNIESWISGLGICAERCAIDHAVLHGNRTIKEVAIVFDADSQCEPRPCGPCLQYILDFAENPEIEIIMIKAKKGKILFETAEVKTLAEFMPHPFRKTQKSPEKRS